MNAERTAEQRYSSGEPMYLHVATAAVRSVIVEWLNTLERGPVYLFEVESVECALEFVPDHAEGFAPHGLVEGGRWRWGRLESGDPDEDETGEDILLDVALSRPLARGRQGRRHRTAFPPYRGGDLTHAEVAEYAVVRAKVNLGRLSLHTKS